MAIPRHERVARPRRNRLQFNGGSRVGHQGVTERV